MIAIAIGIFRRLLARADARHRHAVQMKVAMRVMREGRASRARLAHGGNRQ